MKIPPINGSVLHAWFSLQESPVWKRIVATSCPVNSSLLFAVPASLAVTCFISREQTCSRVCKSWPLTFSVQMDKIQAEAREAVRSLPLLEHRSFSRPNNLPAPPPLQLSYSSY